MSSWLPALRQVTTSALGRPCTLWPWRKGMDFAALRVCSEDRHYVLRVPLREVVTTSYDGTTDFAEVVAREAAVHSVLARAGVPVPRLVGWGRRQHSDGHSWMLLDYVEHDDVTELDGHQQQALGELARHIHSCRPGPDEVPEGPGGPGTPESLLARLSMRYRRATQLLPLPEPSALEPLLRKFIVDESSTELPVVLHMDLRASNLCFRGSRLVGVLDLTNALIGPRQAELGRLHAYGLLSPEFLRGYRGYHSGPVESGPVESGPVESGPVEFDADEWRLVRAYAVDTLALLVALAAEELHDQAMLATMGDRLRDVVVTLLRDSG